MILSDLLRKRGLSCALRCMREASRRRDEVRERGAIKRPNYRQFGLAFFLKQQMGSSDLVENSPGSSSECNDCKNMWITPQAKLSQVKEIKFKNVFPTNRACGTTGLGIGDFLYFAVTTFCYCKRLVYLPVRFSGSLKQHAIDK